jgi:hypothetical protein
VRRRRRGCPTAGGMWGTPQGVGQVSARLAVPRKVRTRRCSGWTPCRWRSSPATAPRPADRRPGDRDRPARGGVPSAAAVSTCSPRRCTPTPTRPSLGSLLSRPHAGAEQPSGAGVVRHRRLVSLGSLSAARQDPRQSETLEHPASKRGIAAICRPASVITSSSRGRSHSPRLGAVRSRVLYACPDLCQ